MLPSAAKTLTLEEFLKRPETQPASEYMDGEITQKPMPQAKHSIIQGELLTTILRLTVGEIFAGLKF